MSVTSFEEATMEESQSLQELDVPVAVTRVQQKGRVQARNRVLSLIPAVVFGVILLLVWYAFT
ncbi:MAG TPA: hypothetical protein VL461_13620, partial [Dictyobacter sp.]|nr:hypothetical protein [Dictyobacter sp.]